MDRIVEGHSSKCMPKCKPKSKPQKKVQAKVQATRKSASQSASHQQKWKSKSKPQKKCEPKCKQQKNVQAKVQAAKKVQAKVQATKKVQAKVQATKKAQAKVQASVIAVIVGIVQLVSHWTCGMQFMHCGWQPVSSQGQGPTSWSCAVPCRKTKRAERAKRKVDLFEPHEVALTLFSPKTYVQDTNHALRCQKLGQGMMF